MSNIKIHYLQHVYFEGPADIVRWARKKGHKLTGTHLYNYEALPDMDGFDWLVIMGGPMNIYEEEKYPWLKYEKQFIKKAIESNKVVLGICLGAQLINDVLGGKVTKNLEREIGWLPVTFNSSILKSSFFKNFPKEHYVFQWHGDTFSTLPEGAVCIASSEVCSNQAFIYNKNVIGFQFHMESTRDSISLLIDNCLDEIKDGGSYVQSEDEIKSQMNLLIDANSLMENFLNGLEAYYLEGK
ncbi:type 1 glutamine amidotransferase [Clostridium kluyveri]|uniref:Amidotransferase n=1 Tax=Clostridium kluyveri TaxID=1534 RepID=A0A1L5F3S1_CLOKL|nr:type 1 glutamine amidotransferase [Clostridium kluyveri]APM37661.1 amidotransferase [Clostridium kluyveri]UZQ52320.1 type 1 glutamine amidotransferase [Clostridium kluyveri]